MSSRQCPELSLFESQIWQDLERKKNKTKHIVVFESGVMFLMLDNDILIQVQADVCNGILLQNGSNF